MTGSTFDGKPEGGQPSSCSLTGPDQHGMYTLSVNEPFFPGRAQDGFQERVMQRLEVSAPSLQQEPPKRFYGRDFHDQVTRMAETVHGSPRASAIVRDTLRAHIEEHDRRAARMYVDMTLEGLDNPTAGLHE